MYVEKHSSYIQLDIFLQCDSGQFSLSRADWISCHPKAPCEPFLSSNAVSQRFLLSPLVALAWYSGASCLSRVVVKITAWGLCTSLFTTLTCCVSEGSLKKRSWWGNIYSKRSLLELLTGCCLHRPLVTVSLWKGQESGGVQFMKPNGSAVPVWCWSPEAFLESCRSSVFLGILKKWVLLVGKECQSTGQMT